MTTYVNTADSHERLSINPEARLDVPGKRKLIIDRAVQGLERIVPQDVVAADAEKITRDAANFNSYDVVAAAEAINRMADSERYAESAKAAATATAANPTEPVNEQLTHIRSIQDRVEAMRSTQDANY